MKIAVRVDASVAMGTGHLLRCLTLSVALRERGIQVCFICREHKGNLISVLQRQAFPVTLLPGSAVSDRTNVEDYASWLGVSQSDDAEQTIQALDGKKFDWLIVDHYGLDKQWEQRLRPHVDKLMVVDDLANRHHDCDLLLDQNFSVEAEGRYRSLVPATCELLVGPRFALLGVEYAAYRKTLTKHSGRPRRLLVFFGGTDPQNMTGLTIEALRHTDLEYLELDVVVGANNPHRQEIEEQIANRPLTTLYKSRPHLADLMAVADLAIGAGGVTTWERMCLGIPAVVVAIADNQKPATEALKQAGLIYYAGDSRQLTAEGLGHFIIQTIGDAAGLCAASQSARLQVDGLGVLRTLEAICPSEASDMRLRPAASEDSLCSYNWIGCREPHTNTIDNQAADLSEYEFWFIRKLEDSSSRLLLLEIAGLPLGQILFEQNQDETNISYSLDRLLRNRGWDAELIKIGAEVMRNIVPKRIEMESDTGIDAPAFLRLSGSGWAGKPTAAEKGFSIAILSDASSWLNEYIPELLLQWLEDGHRVQWVHDKENLRAGEFCFYLSCGQIVPMRVLSRYRNNLVVHESALPEGKGWSPLTWQILEGRNQIPVSLFEATENVDDGAIYIQAFLQFEGHELVGELRAAQARQTMGICRQFVSDYPQILDQAQVQQGDESFYPRRRPEDSKLDPMLSLEAQFEQLRVADNQRYPAYLECRNHRYLLMIQKVGAL
jgi:UDP-2,4-diacetamido-2,4,6-trideoxy-beta-L-altropyranose hydrolase